MKTLAEAWQWYTATKDNLTRMARLGEKYWNDPSMESASIWQDNRFRELDGDDIVAETDASLEPIDDLAIVVLFSVFEFQVRDFLLDVIEPEAKKITHPILRNAAEDAKTGVKEGSFYLRVLAPLKDQNHIPADLITQVAQVREYRNWVAHGRREAPKNNVTPKDAMDRLERFLAVLDDADATEKREPKVPKTDESKPVIP